MCHSSRPTLDGSFEPAQAQALIQYILERFHEPHRRDLADMQALARSLEAQADGPQGLTEGIQAFAQALEDHLFKEEMRLFPMMEQGGSPLIAHLIADMQAEHQAHHDRIEALTSLLTCARLPAQDPDGQVARLRALGGKLVADLLAHIHAEDDVLFPMFLRAAAPAAARAGL